MNPNFGDDISGFNAVKHTLNLFLIKNKFPRLFIVLALAAGIQQAAAQEGKFFRISGPSATTITRFQPDGTLVWSNAQPGATFTIQTVASLPGGTNWVDYVQIPTSTRVNTNQIIEFNPPVGMAFIPAGMFTMGDNLDDTSTALPLHTNYISAIYMDAQLVSYGQWAAVYY